MQEINIRVAYNQALNAIKDGKIGQVEVALQDDETVLDPLLNAPMFWL